MAKQGLPELFVLLPWGKGLLRAAWKGCQRGIFILLLRRYRGYFGYFIGVLMICELTTGFVGPLVCLQAEKILPSSLIGYL